MKIKISSIKFDTSAQLEEFINEKINKLNSNFDMIISADVILKLDKDQKGENKVVEIKLTIPQSNVFAKKQAKTFEEAVDEVCDALKKQLTKVKERMKGI